MTPYCAKCKIELEDQKHLMGHWWKCVVCKFEIYEGGGDW